MCEPKSRGGGGNLLPLPFLKSGGASAPLAPPVPTPVLNCTFSEKDNMHWPTFVPSCRKDRVLDHNGYVVPDQESSSASEVMQESCQYM